MGEISARWVDAPESHWKCLAELKQPGDSQSWPPTSAQEAVLPLRYGSCSVRVLVREWIQSKRLSARSKATFGFCGSGQRRWCVAQNARLTVGQKVNPVGLRSKAAFGFLRSGQRRWCVAQSARLAVGQKVNPIGLAVEEVARNQGLLERAKSRRPTSLPGFGYPVAPLHEPMRLGLRDH